MAQDLVVNHSDNFYEKKLLGLLFFVLELQGYSRKIHIDEDLLIC